MNEANTLFPVVCLDNAKYFRTLALLFVTFVNKNDSTIRWFTVHTKYCNTIDRWSQLFIAKFVPGCRYGHTFYLIWNTRGAQTTIP